MKKTRKLLCLLLALVLVAGLLPGTAFAAGETGDAEPEAAAEPDAAEEPTAQTEGIIGDLIDDLKNDPDSDAAGARTYNATVLANVLGVQVPAIGAKITLTDQLTGESVVYSTGTAGVALLKPKRADAVYSVSAEWTSLLGIKYISLPGLTWSVGVLPDLDVIHVYPVPNIGLNLTDHIAYIHGYPDGTVRPQGTLTRAEAAAMLYRIIKPSELNNTTYAAFTDIQGHWAQTEISALANKGIIKGTSATTFSPDVPIRRQDFFTLIGRMFAKTYATSGRAGQRFSDLGSGYYVEYINMLYDLDIIKGDGNFVRPADNITRAETAALLNRLVLRQPDADSGAPLGSQVKTWSDNPPDAWYYADIQEASNSHNYTLNFKFGASAYVAEVWTSIKG